MIDDAAIMPSLDMVLVLRVVRAPDGSVADTLVEFANEAWLKTWAEGNPAAIGRPLTVVAPSLAADRRPIIERLAAGGPEVRMRVRHPADPRSLADIQATPMGDRILIVVHALTREDVLDQALRESDARFRSAMDDAPEAIGILRPVLDDAGHFVDAEVLYLNRTALDRWLGGATLENVTGRQLLATWPSVGAQVFDVYRDVVETGRGFSGERQFDSPAGPLWIELHVSMTPEGILHASRDVTDTHRAQAALEASEARFAAVIGAVRETIALLQPIRDENGEIIDLEIEWVNNGWLAAFGWIGRDPRGQSAFAIRPEFADLLPVHRRVLEAGEREDVELRLADGRWLAIAFSRLDDGLLAVARDVTGQREAEAAIRGRLVAAIEQTSDSVMVTDRDANVIYVNPAFERTSGYGRDEVIGHNPRFLQGGVQPPGFYADMWSVLTAGQTWRGEMVNRRKDGLRFIEDMSVSPVLDGSGEVTAYVAVKRDITAERDMEARLQRAQRLEAVGRLTGGVAHDFNNPLAAIQGYAGFVQAALPEDAAARSDVSEVLKAADRAATLTRQLLAFSRRKATAPRIVDPASVVGDLMPMLRRLLGDHIELDLLVAPDVPSVLVDPGQLEQVVVNLAVNARDAMPEGGHLAIGLSRLPADGPVPSDAPAFQRPSALPGPWLRLSVADTGCGMDEATVARILDPFFTTKPEGVGTGLGLATVDSIVADYGGRLGVRSAIGQGTTFTIDIPARESAPEPNAADSGPSEVPMGSEVILLVEDDPSVRNVLARILGRLGYTVVQAGSGSEALALAASSERFDLLLSDVRMPGIQGPELARRFVEVRPAVPVLLMSAFPGAEDGPGPAIQVLEKPFDTGTLARALRRLLDAGSPAPVAGG